jgi:hypothetical protein
MGLGAKVCRERCQSVLSIMEEVLCCKMEKATAPYFHRSNDLLYSLMYILLLDCSELLLVFLLHLLELSQPFSGSPTVFNNQEGEPTTQARVFR